MKLFTILCFTLWCSTIEAATPEQPKTVIEYKITNASSHQKALTLKFEENNVWTNDELWDTIVSNKNCFILTKSSNASQLWMSVDFGFDVQDKRRLFATLEPEKHFCLSDYIYLNRLNEYHLFLNTGGHIEHEATVKLAQVKRGNQLVQEPGNASFSGGWLYYSSVFDYSFEKSVDGHHENFYACDVILNCFAFESKLLEGNNKTLLYSLPVEARNKLRNTTPFVQILGENNKRVDSSKFKLHYNDANKQALAKLKSLNPEFKSEPNNSISHIQKVNHQSDRIRVKIPISVIDLRLQEVVTTVSILSGRHSSLRLIGLRSVPGSGFSWSVPDGINHDTTQLNVSTRLFYALGLEEFPDQELLNQALELDYQVIFDPVLSFPSFPDAQLDVQIEFKINLLDKFDHPNAKSFPIGGFEQFPEISNFGVHQRSSIENSNLNTFSWATWSYDRSDLRMIKAYHDLYATVNFTYEVSTDGVKVGETLNPQNLQITRVILGSRGKHFKATPLKLHFFNSTHATFHDQIHFTDLPKEEEYFKLGYLTRLEGVEEDDEIDFHYHAHEFDHAENCKKVPTFSKFNCDQELFKCPAYFTFDTNQGICKLVHK